MTAHAQGELASPFRKDEQHSWTLRRKMGPDEYSQDGGDLNRTGALCSGLPQRR